MFNKIKKNTSTYLSISTLFVLVLASMYSRNLLAEECIGNDGSTKWECVNKEEILISPPALALQGTEPEIFVSVSLLKKDGNQIELNDLMLPDGVKLEANDQFVIEYKLINGMSQEELKALNIDIEEGFFDKDGDPIDRTRIFESIQWIVNDINSGQNSVIKNEVRNSFLLSQEYCSKDLNLGFSITPFTHTGTPDVGQEKTFQLYQSDGTPLNLATCLLAITEDDVKIVLKKKSLNSESSTIYIDERQKPLSEYQLDTPKNGDQYELSLWVLDNGQWSDITEKYQSSFQWGFASLEKDDINRVGDEKAKSQTYWVEKSKGANTFSYQKNNSDSKISSSPNGSEQALRVIFKFSTE